MQTSGRLLLKRTAASSSCPRTGTSCCSAASPLSFPFSSPRTPSHSSTSALWGYASLCTGARRGGIGSTTIAASGCSESFSNIQRQSTPHARGPHEDLSVTTSTSRVTAHHAPPQRRFFAKTGYPGPPYDPLADSNSCVMENIQRTRSSRRGVVERIEIGPDDPPPKGPPGRRSMFIAAPVNPATAMELCNDEDEVLEDPRSRALKRQRSQGLKPDGSVRPLTRTQYEQYALQCAVPMIGFGFVDNTIMITVGDAIDAHFSAMVSTLTAAAFGQCCSDVAGTSFGGFVDAAAAKMGLPDARVTPLQADLAGVRAVRVGSMALGVICGCLLGMFPLLFIDTKRNERRRKAKELRTLFTSVADEGQRSLNVERCSLYIDEDGAAVTMWALAKRWSPSQAQIDDCARRALDPETGKLSTQQLNEAFKSMKFRYAQLPTTEAFIRKEELPGLLKKMLATGENTNNTKLEKKRIKKNGTKYIVLKSLDPENAMLNLADVYADSRFVASRKYDTNASTRTRSENAWRAHSVLIGPVLRNGKIVGCIEMINKKSHPDLQGGCVPFTKNDERLMRLLCNHCSIFLNQLETTESLSELLLTPTDE